MLTDRRLSLSEIYRGEGKELKSAQLSHKLSQLAINSLASDLGRNPFGDMILFLGKKRNDLVQHEVGKKGSAEWLWSLIST